MQTLARLRRDARDFLKEKEKILYRNQAGLSGGGGLSALQARYPRLADLESLQLSEALLGDAGEETERFRLELLREMLARAVVDRNIGHLSDALMEKEAAARVKTQGIDLPYRAVPAAVSSEASRERRRLLEAGRVEVLRSLDPLYREIWSRTRQGCLEQGRADLADLVSETVGVDLDSLAGEAERFLVETHDQYNDFLGWLARRKLGLSRDELESHDLSHLFYFPELRAAYPGEVLIPGASASTIEMGLDLHAEGRITLDLEPRAGKTSRAFCARLDVPSEIVLVIHSRGGVDDYRAFFHELGHSLHFAHVDPDLPFEGRYLDDSAVTEAWAFTLESLPVNPLWVSRHLDQRPGKDFFRALKLAKLFLVRRYAAKIAYELDLWRAANLDDLPERYDVALRRATGAAYPRSAFLADVDPFFYVARYLRGWMLSSQIVESLRERFDEEWFRRPQTGAWLEEEWRVGAVRPERVSEELGAQRLDTAALTREFLEAF